MRYAILGLPLLLCSSGVLSGQTGSSKLPHGSELYHACQAAIRVMDRTPKQGDIGSSEFCRGYFTAFYEFNTLLKTSICMSGSTVGTTERVYVQYMEKNPKLMDEMMLFGLTDAMKANYSCPAKR